VVLVCLGGRSGTSVRLTARADLPAPSDAVALAAALAARMAGEDPSGVVLAIVSEAPDPPGDLPHRDLVHALVLALAARSLPLRDALLVRRSRWWSYDCPHPCCAPRAGTPLPSGTSALEAATVYEGRVVADDRAALAGRIAPAGDPLGVMAAETLRVGSECSARIARDGWEAVVEESWTAVTEAVARCRQEAGGALTPAEVARIAWGLRNAAVRDRVLALALGDDAAPAERLWTECTRRAPAPLDAAPATLLAVSAWLRGDGTLAGLALDRARDSDPRYTLAGLLEEALAAGVRPEQLRGWIAAGLER
jgi:hypothetical protein